MKKAIYPKFHYRIARDEFGLVLWKLRLISPNGIKTWSYPKNITGGKARDAHNKMLVDAIKAEGKVNKEGRHD